MDTEPIVTYWIKSSEEDYKTAEGLLGIERFVHSLFFCHLAVEKILKAGIVKATKNQAPYDHNLYILSRLSTIEFTKEQLDLLDEINTFNIKGRYDDYKFKFHLKATREYAEKYFKASTELYLWIKTQITK